MTVLGKGSFGKVSVIDMYCNVFIDKVRMCSEFFTHMQFHELCVFEVILTNIPQRSKEKYINYP
jgi:hypothetical protein